MNGSQRALAIKIIYDVVFKKLNLKNELSVRTQNHQHASFIKSLCYETIRHYGGLEKIWRQSVTKKPKDKIVQVALTQAVCEKMILQKPSHAIVNETVQSLKKLKKNWASSLLNASLRACFENADWQLKPEDSHPLWWAEKTKNDWPDNYEAIFQANLDHPPFWVRMAKSQTPEHKQPSSQNSDWQPHSNIEGAYIIPAANVAEIPEFQQGVLSVQDASAQLAAMILAPQEGERILDACAAPGGKTGHLLELNPNIQLVALEKYPNRAKKIEQNLSRLQKSGTAMMATKNMVKIKVADAKNVDEWFDGKVFDKILLDVPCSASGILRRQPDIKFHRSPEELTSICEEQAGLLSSVSKVLKPGGQILYATCSIFSEENQMQIKRFLKTNQNFKERPLEYDFANRCEHGIQILPGTQNMDGFYYCVLEKTTEHA